jgi:hypothetical protein
MCRLPRPSIFLHALVLLSCLLGLIFVWITSDEVGVRALHTDVEKTNFMMQELNEAAY